MPRPDARSLLRDAKVVVAPETFALVSIDRAAFAKLLGDPSVSPGGGEAPFMILVDRYEVTLLLSDGDLSKMRSAIGGARVESGFRMLTFDIELGFDVVGFMAAVSATLADAGIPIVPVSAFSRDHLLIKQDALAAALKVLGEHVSDLC